MNNYQNNNNGQFMELMREMPGDINTEKTVLGTIIRQNELYGQVEDILTPDAFKDPYLQVVFRCVRWLIRGQKVVDVNAILGCAKEHHTQHTITEVDVLDCVSYNSPTTFQQDVERLVDYGRRRKAWKMLQAACNDLLTLTEDADEVMTGAMRQLDDYVGNGSIDNTIITAEQGLRLVYNQINDNLSGINKATVKTGFRFTDAKGGLRLGSVTVIGAWTSVGKTSLAMNMAENMSVCGIPGAYYSLEMGAVELWARLLSHRAGINAGKILNYPLRRDEISSVDHATTPLLNIPLYIDDKATTSFKKVLRSIRTMVKRKRIKFFVIDYLQIFSQNNNGKEEANIAFMARECKNICRELNIAGIILSQLRRDKEERHPTIDMLRGSGQIEESADNIVLIDRPQAHPEWGVFKFSGKFNKESIDGKAELRVSKGRNIGLGTYLVGFDAPKTMFYELDGYKIGDDIAFEDDGVAPVNNKEESDDSKKEEQQDNAQAPFRPAPEEQKLPF